MVKPTISNKPNPKRIRELRKREKLRQNEKNPTAIIEENKKQERMRKIVEIVRKRQNNPLSYIPRYLPEAEISILSKRYKDRITYEKRRNLKTYNAELEREPFHIKVEPTIERIIESFRKTKLRVLDLGAGEGNLGIDLEKLYPNVRENKRKKVEYEGIDILPSSNPKVKTFDFTYKKLPKNTYDLIISMWSLDYVGNKLRTIQNCCDALQVNGKLILHTHTNKSLLKETLERDNPHLQIDIESTNGIIITKTKDLPTIINLRLESIKPVDQKRYYEKYNPKSNVGIQYESTALKTNYSRK